MYVTFTRWRTCSFRHGTLARVTACRQRECLNEFFSCKKKLEHSAQHWDEMQGPVQEKKKSFFITVVVPTMLLCPVQLLNSASWSCCFVHANAVATLYKTKNKRTAFLWRRKRMREAAAAEFLSPYFFFPVLRTVVHSRSICSVPLRCDGHFHGLVL